MAKPKESSPQKWQGKQKETIEFQNTNQINATAKDDPIANTCL